MSLKASLPNIRPAPDNSPIYRNLVTDRFTYGLVSDKDTFDAFYAATQDTFTYEVPFRTGRMVNTIGFSEYLMFWKCNAFNRESPVT